MGKGRFKIEEIAEATGLERLGRSRVGGRRDQIDVKIRVRQKNGTRYMELLGMTVGPGTFGIGPGSGWGAQVSIRVPYLYGLGPKLLLLRQGMVRTWLTRFGYQDIQVGVPQLDFLLTVKGQPEHWVRRVLQENEAEILAAANEGSYSFPESNGRELSWTCHLNSLQRESSLETLSKRLDLLVQMARTDFAGLSHLQALPGATLSENSGVPSVQLLRQGKVCTVQPIRHKGRFATELSVEGPEASPTTLHCPPSQSRATLEEVLRHREFANYLAGLSGAFFRREGTRYSLTFTREKNSHQDLLQAADQLVSLIGESSAIYR